MKISTNNLTSWQAIFISTLLSFSSITAQITITAGDILDQIGSSRMIEVDTSESVTVDVGSAGANQTWDFSASDLTNASLATFEQLKPEGTPFEDLFVEANMVEKITRLGIDGAIYNYRLIENDRFVSLGTGSMFTFDGMDFTTITPSVSTIAPLPLTFGSGWMEITRDTMEPAPDFMTIDYDSSVSIVDAWGTIELPEGCFEVLRLRTDQKSEIQSFFQGALTATIKSTNINYAWVSKNDLIVASASSQNDETDPGFTNASSFTRLSGGSTPTQNVQIITSQLGQNFPNPFHSETQISFSLDRSQNISLRVYNLAGKEILALAEGNIKLDFIKSLGMVKTNSLGPCQ